MSTPLRPNIRRLKIVINGTVQGVGFRPFVYRLAHELHLRGWVSNTSQGVFIEAEADETTLAVFAERLQTERPVNASIYSFESTVLDATGYSDFEIRESEESGPKTVFILPDIALCPDCLQELFDSNDRRYLYPFINCTNCGPRFSIINALPYDRPNTSMASFVMCNQCRTEYENPADRRFHAQPNACPHCGPHVEFWNESGSILSAKVKAIEDCIAAMKHGEIVAMKGIGGFHLIVDARNVNAILRLRERKHREEKPFALMYPDLISLKNACYVSDAEERLLSSPAAPIVLLQRKETDEKAVESIAPGNPYLGAMLPYTPLHHIILRQLGFPVIATSGNLSEEPICTDEFEAVERLRGIADYFLVHNRPIVRHVDDSIARIIKGREYILRRARGYAPLPVNLKFQPSPMIAVGAHLKNTVAITAGKSIIVSQHIGDLSTQQSHDAFIRIADDLRSLYEVVPASIVCDKHPDYLSTKFAHAQQIPIISVQHHVAHVAGCMTENEIDGPVLGVAWDGTGLGDDGTIWGGEFFHVTDADVQHIASFRPFHLPGGDVAIREPRRTALSLLWNIYGERLLDHTELDVLKSFSPNELQMVLQAMKKNLNAPLTSSVGRLFDAVVALTGVRLRSNFEGQAAMELEFAAHKNPSDSEYSLEVSKEGALYRIDWKPMILEIINDLKNDERHHLIPATFHNTLCRSILDIARLCNEHRVVLSGGCFQNKYLLERTIDLLQENGFSPYWHQRIPTNDGGISLGQIAAAFHMEQAQGVKKSI
jgi:hydrogenase maturation protein HypF